MLNCSFLPLISNQAKARAERSEQIRIKQRGKTEINTEMQYFTIVLGDLCLPHQRSDFLAGIHSSSSKNTFIGMRMYEAKIVTAFT